MKSFLFYFIYYKIISIVLKLFLSFSRNIIAWSLSIIIICHLPSRSTAPSSSIGHSWAEDHFHRITFGFGSLILTAPHSFGWFSSIYPDFIPHLFNLFCARTKDLCKSLRIDEELIGVPMMGGGVVNTMTLMPPPPASPKQMIRGGSGKQRNLKRFASTTGGTNRSMTPQQLPSVEYISERSSDVSFSGMSNKKRNGKPPSGKWTMILIIT